jgi:nucleoside-diphosphate-sugar epimerase
LIQICTIKLNHSFMRVFVTGASGFVGSAIVKELLQAGHQVLGMVRSDSAAEALGKTGAEAYLADLNDLEKLTQGAAQCDAVIHTAFNHDFSRFKQSCEEDYHIIKALAAGNPFLVVTSALGFWNYDRVLTEDEVAPSRTVMPRAATEEAAREVNAYIVRLSPTTHGEGDHGFTPMLINIAKGKGESAYIGEGKNHWAAVHRFDAAVMYRLIIEQRPAQQVFHAVAEEGIPFRVIAEAIGKGLNIPVVSKSGEEATEYFGWFRHFGELNIQASSAKSQEELGWKPKEIGLLEDLVAGKYF